MRASPKRLTLATKLGVDAENLMPVIQASMVRSGVVEYKAPFVLNRDFTANFPLRLMHKDIRLTLEAAKEVRVNCQRWKWWKRSTNSPPKMDTRI